MTINSGALASTTNGSTGKYQRAARPFFCA
jgi:hypothetical protein